jgi:hypothetical protein
MRGLSVLVLALPALAAAQEPKKTESIKPPWQRQLGFFDRVNATRYENRLRAFQEEGRFTEALAAA